MIQFGESAFAKGSGAVRFRPQVEALEERTLLHGGPGPNPLVYTLVGEGTHLAEHIHPHLSIFINGQAQVIPADIGVGPTGLAFPLHTHDASGTIHIESPVAHEFTLRDFFAVWQQSFDEEEILGHHADAFHRLTITMTVNGQPSTAFGALVLHDKDDIVIQAMETPVPAREAVAYLFTHSDENYSNVVADAYVKLLGRSPDPSGQAFWLGQMQQGLTDEGLEAFLLGSAEYASSHEETARTWLQGVYEDMFQRAPDEAGFTFWLSRLDAGTPRDEVALAFTTSTERETLKVADTYRTYLRREPDAAGSNFWVHSVDQGLTREELVGLLLSSEEYYQSPTRGQGMAVTWIQSCYRDLLHRAAGDAEVRFWESVLAEH